jgi:hypothetical protein
MLKMKEHSIWPELRKNREYPVVSFQAELIANSIPGSLEAQSFWFRATHCQSI